MKKIRIAYVITLFCFSLFSYLFIDPNFFYLHVLFTGFFAQYRMLTTSAFVLFLFLLFLWYLLFLSHAERLSIKHIMILIIGGSILLLFAYPAILSFDIFNYIATAKVTFFYHENPYIIMPIEFTKDPLLLFMHAANKTALYAPFWIFLTAFPYLLGFGSFLFILFNFKLFILIAYLLTLLLLWKMAKSKKKIVFFALNPLVLIETLVSSHNDIVMMLLLLLSIYFYGKNRHVKSLLFYIPSVGIKYATLILVPLFPLIMFKQWSKEKFFSAITITMTIIFFLSSFREEIYPWYGIWILLPGTFLIDKKWIQYMLIALSFGLLLRYIPFMLLGTYFGPTPLLKIVLFIIPLFLTTCFILVKNYGKTFKYH